MNRSLVALGLVVAMLVPTQAFAWFGWLDKLSGPGPFWGLLFDVRVVCFGEKYHGPELSDALQAIERARTLEQRSLADMSAADAEYNQAPDKRNVQAADRLYQVALASRTAVNDSWDAALQTWRTSDLAWAIVGGLDRKDPRLVYSPTPPPDPNQSKSIDPEVNIRLSKDRIALIQTRVEQIKPEIKSLQESVYRTTQRVAFSRSIGVLVSACSNNTSRRSSIDVGAGLWKVLKDGSPNTGDRLTTLRAAYVIRLADFLDYSSGVGAFWVTSERYDAVRSLYIEPARLHAHFPDSWNTLTLKGNRAKRLLAVPVLSWGPTVFPTGFRAGVFRDENDRLNSRIKGEVIWKTFAVHVNVHPASKRTQ